MLKRPNTPLDSSVGKLSKPLKTAASTSGMAPATGSPDPAFSSPPPAFVFSVRAQDPSSDGIKGRNAPTLEGYFGSAPVFSIRVARRYANNKRRRLLIPPACNTRTTSTFGAVNTGGLIVGAGQYTFGNPSAIGGFFFSAPVTTTDQFVFSPRGAISMAPYQVTNLREGSNIVSLQSISAMQQYEDTSHEELRMKDYAVVTNFFDPPSSTAEGGTRLAPYQVTNYQDGPGTYMIQSISAMPNYIDKSPEELRMEDYTLESGHCQTCAKWIGTDEGPTFAQILRLF